MEKLKRFNKSNKKRNIIIVSAFLLIGIILAGISYAVYQKEDEVLFINARVGHFETTSSDIELAMKLDGEDVDVPPSKGYYNVVIECDNATGKWDEEEWGAVISNISSNRVKCNVNFETLNGSPLSIVNVGDYISMTPTSTSYTPPSELTGCLNDSNCTQNTINPSELNLWRVISKNEDGTVDVVSEYVSSVDVYFYGKTGYMNLIGGLNEIAEQYTNSKYVQSTRCMGYSNQIEKCSTLSASECPGDYGYEVDINLVQRAAISLTGKTSQGSSMDYYLASRGYSGIDGGTGRASYYGRIIDNGTLVPYSTEHWIWNTGLGNNLDNSSFRPILTLKSDTVIISGEGTNAENAYQLS